MNVYFSARTSKTIKNRISPDPALHSLIKYVALFIPGSLIITSHSLRVLLKHEHEWIIMNQACGIFCWKKRPYPVLVMCSQTTDRYKSCQFCSPCELWLSAKSAENIINNINIAPNTQQTPWNSLLRRHPRSQIMNNIPTNSKQESINYEDMLSSPGLAGQTKNIMIMIRSSVCLAQRNRAIEVNIKVNWSTRPHSPFHQAISQFSQRERQTEHGKKQPIIDNIYSHFNCYSWLKMNGETCKNLTESEYVVQIKHVFWLFRIGSKVDLVTFLMG